MAEAVFWTMVVLGYIAFYLVGHRLGYHQGFQDGWYGGYEEEEAHG